ncbi:hypothetical protein SCB71_15955 [Herbiconiux sp. KACC 21604]|uniref:hypothetical protein n=1 Tax=unclassified Herbiconiux TaxID=2618217 RepID=UPI001492EE9D|nr:hypothetical protein [Herbiconiux sp. SALV-R1]QJU54613.1 hypothetical protein HL652_13905 [Herbiconiux sp. SALV-R1]WPO85700.1 hypothetical protein SCB71_15955 [Herbiconiux sp. KACC 21604]
MAGRLFRGIAAGALALATVAGVSACGTAPWDQSRFNTDAPETSSTAAATPTARPTITPVVNELATGSAKHLLQAGDIAMTVDYYSTLSMDQWTAEANKPITFSLTGALGTDDGQSFYLSRVTLTPAVDGPTGSLPAPAAITDQAAVQPGYYIKSPYSYSQTFILPALDPAATSVTLSFTYEILLQTAPGSNDYAKQTATDQLTVAIAQTPDSGSGSGSSDDDN